ncbi:condensation domain-containing protein [Burkholderia contaminans]|uniref:condensation domain-containing protein n=1 Tax=Burkholderia contaminans TaxID=488447 RepID=UPI0008728071|nr:condensation domain-containing protein [Burkholderia contaminans]
MVLLAGFNLFLHRVAGQQEIVTGIPVTGRSVAGSDRLAGYCTHLLPLHSTLPEQATVASFLAGTRQNLLDALEHQDYPFAELVREIGAQRDLNAAPLVSAVFNLEPVSALPELRGLTVGLVAPADPPYRVRPERQRARRGAGTPDRLRLTTPICSTRARYSVSSTSTGPC